MRKSPINALFPKVRHEILAATYGQPERWWFLSELAAFIGVTPSSLQRELKSLCESGILRERRDGNRSYVQAESDSFIFQPLRDLIEKTSGIATVVGDALRPFRDDIVCAFLYGSVARGDDGPTSDVDVFVIGQIGLAGISGTLRQVERRLNREINVTCYSEDEFREKAANANHFVTSILGAEKEFLIGDKNDLDRLTGQRNGSGSPDEHTGD